MSKIEDFGSKIGGARKDVWAKRGLQIEDIIDMTEAEKEKYIKRDYIWPKENVVEELEEGTPRFIIYWRNEIRKTVNTKNKGRISEDEYIEGVRKVRNMVEKVQTEEDIAAFEEAALHGVFFNKLYGRTYEYVKPFGDILAGNRFLKNTGRYSIENMKRKMEKENFALTEDEIKVKCFPIVFIDGKEYAITKKDGKTFLSHKTAFGQEFFYLNNEDIALTDNSYALLNEKNRLLFCDAKKENCEKEREQIFMAQKDSKTKKRKKGKSKWVPKQFENLERVGQTWRSLNKHVSGETLLQHFGIRAGEFGNWTNNLERQTSLDQTYDAFCDLAHILGIDDTSVSLPGLSCGSLAIAYGSRGRGDAVAHYEPLREVINLTKLRGAGSLGHEWAHALDHLIGQKNECRGLATESQYYGIPSLVTVMNVIYFKKDGSTHTNYYENSIQFDKSYSKHGQGYWSSSCELFARAFACYLTDKFKEKGYKNDFLNGHSDTYVSVNKKGEQIYAYPRGEERRRINQAIDSLILNLKHTGILKQRRNRKIEVNRKENNHTVYAFSTSADGQLFFG